MRDAVSLVLGERSIRSVAKEKKLSHITLSRYVKKQKEKPNEVIRMTPSYSVRKIFTTEQEDLLADYLLTCSKMFYGLSMLDVRKLAFEMANKNNVLVPDK